MKKTLIAPILAFLCFITACSSPSSSDDLYLSFATIETEYDGTIGGKGTLSVYYQALDSEEATKVFSSTFCASYPAAVYDKRRNCVYYSDKLLPEGQIFASDKVLRYDCETKESEVLIEHLTPINDIYLRNDGDLVIVSGNTDGTDMQPYLYDPDNGQITKLDVNGDFIFGSNYDPRQDTFVFCGYKDSELKKSFENKEDKLIPNRIYTYDDHVEEIATIPSSQIPSVVMDGDRILYGKDIITGEPYQYELLHNGQTQSIPLQESLYLLVALDGDDLICVYSTHGFDGLYSYNLKTKRYDKTYFFQADEEIYSAHLVKR